MADRKTAQKITDIAKKYPERLLACRDQGHSWEPIEATWLQDGNIERILGCTRCETRRVQYLDKRGYVIGGHYEYADGYQMKGLGRLDTDGRAILRRTHVMQQLG
jgi:hypothetical protein